MAPPFRCAACRWCARDEISHRLIAAVSASGVRSRPKTRPKAKKAGGKKRRRARAYAADHRWNAYEETLLGRAAQTRSRRDRACAFLVADAMLFALAYLDISQTAEFPRDGVRSPRLAGEIAPLEPGESSYPMRLYGDPGSWRPGCARSVVTPLTRDVFRGSHESGGFANTSRSHDGTFGRSRAGADGGGGVASTYVERRNSGVVPPLSPPHARGALALR